ncbi:DUF4397 domain-containing protein [Pedobacter heparinus]|uniref:DUF4397 domain-containing protein n=1 Tax=Pedobacter heparinus (strain ATCC 13125 / DSM 2366 / CIP 104194 / JCM 7457 / NBRC 12017 / NCIMB 9290 / NRRL B-14731 / HIM 762-3) TaxID=485917 RepID=C6XWN1_PEDHD|nr:DUF4397 domain-containing protein [Pedobacter heparinus]ACU06320.1 hypothetical protein Phep_4129 [Pedobacter heparinus DSM 2366]
MKIFRNLLIIFCSLLFLSSCQKTVGDYGDVRKFGDEQPLIKINYASPYKDDRMVIVKFNGRRVTSQIQNRTPFPGGGYNTRGDVRADYLTVDPGQVKVTVAMPFKKDNGLDSLELYNTTINIESGKKYVIHIADTAKFTKSVLTEENFLKPDSGYAVYRFINLMPNVPAVDLYYGQSATDNAADKLVAGNIGYLQISNYITLNRYAGRTWKIRPAGAAVTTATVLANYTSASSLLNQRTYTVYAHGYAGMSSATEKPYVSFFHIR